MEVAVFEFGPKNQISPNAIDGDFFLMLIHTFLKLLTKCQLYIILFGVITHFDCTIYKSSYIYNTSQVELEILRNFSTIFRTATGGVPQKSYSQTFRDIHIAVGSCEYREICNKTYSKEHLRMASFLESVL